MLRHPFKKLCGVNHRKNMFLTPKNFILYFMLLMLPRIVQKTVHSFGNLYSGAWNYIFDFFLIASVSIIICLFLMKIENYRIELEQLSDYDKLTGLPNGKLLGDNLDLALARCQRSKHILALLYLDLDHFKDIVDIHGHATGDELLISVADRLKSTVHHGDSVARHGGDEFYIVLENVSELEIRKAAEHVLHVFNEPFVVKRNPFYTSCSIGISLYPQDGENKENLLQHADTAMHLAKHHGRNQYRFFDHTREDMLGRKLQLEQGLRTALDNQEFILHYQPQIELGTGKCIGTEVLIRWIHPEYGLISPAEFIPIAEETGLILPIGDWVMEQACRQNKLWHDQGISSLKVSVNVSALQFQEEGFVKKVKHVLKKYKLPYEFLELEITESMMQNTKELAERLNQLKDLGVKISIDDFGTGFSSLSLLNQLPIDNVKIDQTFMQDIAVNFKSASLVKTIIQMAWNLDFDVIAEGIENEQQAFTLYHNGCRYVQGYLYSRPLPAKELESIIRNGFSLNLGKQQCL